MATRGRPKSDQKHIQILDAAAELFTSNGYAKTSLEQLAAAADVSRQTIYSHFADKADVLREAVKYRCEQRLLSVEHVDYSIAPQQFLREFAHRFIALLSDEGALKMYRLCVHEGVRYPELGEAFFEAGPGMVGQVLSTYLEVANDRGELCVQQPEIAAMQFLFAVRGYPVDRLLLNAPEQAYAFDDQDYIEYCCQSFLKAHAPSQ